MTSRNIFTLKTRHQQGFTLLEVMVAISIIAIALTTIFGSQSQGVSFGTEVKFNVTAALLASLKLAELESGRMEPDSDSGDFGDEFPGFTWKTEAEKADIDGPEALTDISEDLHLVDLTVSWGEEVYNYQARIYVLAR